MTRISHRPRVLFFLLAWMALGLVPNSSQGQATETWRSWNQPVEPFRIAGNVYYVGAVGIAAYLITTPEGHIVIDGGFVETAPLILDGIRKLGFQAEDVKILLNSHAHFDHCGGLAELAEVTGARVMISEPDAGVIESGGKNDFLFADVEVAHFPPVKVDRRLKDGETVALGGTVLTAHITAGHTQGCTTWALQVEEEGQNLDVVSICSTSVLDEMDLSINPSYPGIADDFAASFERLESLPCDVFLASHPSFFGMKGKLESRAAGKEGNPFIDPEGYQAYVSRGKKRYLEVLESERSEEEAKEAGSR